MSTLLPIITKITQAIKSEDRVHIELDGKYWVTLSKDKLLELKIYKGKEIDPEEKKCIETAASFQKALLKVMHFISIRPRSKQEIIRYIKKKELLDFSEELLVKLENTGLVDDEAFTRWYVDNRTSFGTHGANKIKMELVRLGVANSIIDEEIRKRREEDPKGGEERIVEYIQKNINKVTAHDKYELERKIFTRLAGRGFEYGEIKRGWKKYRDTLEEQSSHD